MKLAFYIVILMHVVLQTSKAAGASSLDDLQEESFMYDGFEVIKLRTKRDEKTKIDKLKSHKLKKQPKMEIIPADKSLLTLQFAQEIEEKLGNTSIGKFSGKRKRKRRGPHFNNVLRKGRGILFFKPEATGLYPNAVASNLEVEEVKKSSDEGDDGTIHEEIHKHHFRKSNSHTQNGKDSSINKNNDDHDQIGDKFDTNVPLTKDTSADVNSKGQPQVDSADLHGVHNILAGKEQDLITEMIRLKDSLDEAISLLKDKKKSQGSSGRQDVALKKVLARAVRAIAHDQCQQRNIRRKREGKSLEPYRACIYIDIPGSQPDDEVEIFIPGALESSNCVANQDNTISDKGSDYEADQTTIDNETGTEFLEPETEEATETAKESLESEALQATSSASETQPIAEKLTQLELNQEGQEVSQSATEIKDTDISAIYWLRIPPAETVHSKEVFGKLYNVVKEFHESGKDVLFVPVSKTYSDTEEVKRGFLKTLRVDPINVDEKLKQLTNLEIKLM